ncbi:MAG TPA: hypothetical protein VMT95_07540 [Candidatus Binatia bacterium]|nr:hypothetical protein [Candidatus Binatia bacterium]
MIGPVGREILTAAIIAAALGLSACGGGSVNPPAGEPASALRSTVTPGAFPDLTKPSLYVANFYGSTVTVYAPTAKGNTKPLHTIAGSKTGLKGPYGVAVDAGYNVSVVNTNGGPSSTGSVTVYKSGAYGNVAPTRTIGGSNTGLFYPFGIALDSSKNAYVANYNGQSVTVYAASAKGNVAPIRTISGPNTGLFYPEGIVLSGTGKTYVANSSGASVTVYPAGANGNVTPVQTISGSNTGLNQPQGIALGNSKIYVANFAGSVTVYRLGANGNAAPVQTISGSNTGLNEPFGVAVKGSVLYVANESNNTITVYSATGSGNVAPIRTISGSNTGLNGPAGILLH